MSSSLFLFTLVLALGLVSCAGLRPQLQNVENEVSVSSNSLLSNATDATTLLPPPIFTSISPSSGSALGGYIVSINGSNLLSMRSIRFSVTNDGCNGNTPYRSFCNSPTYSVQDTAMTFVMPPGGGNGQSVISLSYIVSNSLPYPEISTFSSVNYLFTYTSDLVNITQVVPATIPQTGGNITISGTNFGTVPGKVALYFNVLFVSAVPLTVLSWNNTRIMCSAPAGTGVSGLRVILANGVYTPAFPYSYTPKNTDPFIKNVTTDGVSFTITGLNFGTIPGDNGAVYANSVANSAKTTFQIISWSTSKIVFQNNNREPFIGSSLVVVTDAGLQSAQYVPYDFVPFVAGLSVTSGPVTGNISLTVTGSTFNPGSSIVTLNGNGISIQLSCNPGLDTYTSITCQLPPAPAGTYIVVVKMTYSGSHTTYSSSSVATASNTFTYVSCAPKNAINPACSCLLVLPICYSVATLPLVKFPAISGSVMLTYRVNQTAIGYAFAQDSYVKVNTTILSYTNGKVKVNPFSVTSVLAAAWDGELPVDLGCICA